MLQSLTFKIHKQQKDFIEIHRLDFENDFKWQADDSDHHRVRVEGEFPCPVADGTPTSAGLGYRLDRYDVMADDLIRGVTSLWV